MFVYLLLRGTEKGCDYCVLQWMTKHTYNMSKDHEPGINDYTWMTNDHEPVINDYTWMSNDHEAVIND